MTTSSPQPDTVQARTNELLGLHQREIWRANDRMFAGLLVFEWIVMMAVALGTTPWTYRGTERSLHPHAWEAIILGGMLVAMPLFLVRTASSRPFTRQIIAVSQMLMSALLIHAGNGRIELHFHIFGSLAFLAFYRDWRVLITATLVVAFDHAVRGLVSPLTIYGQTEPTIWRTAEHAGWVIFIDLFLVMACLKSVREMRGIAEQRALLERSHREVELKVEERTAELKTAQAELLKTARTAGMAEIATSVLHNVGNVLNSVNIAANVAADKLRGSELPNLGRVGQMLDQHRDDLGQFITQDARGKLIPQFITELSGCLIAEHDAVMNELGTLHKGVEHIKEIIIAQQSMARCANVKTAVRPGKMLESALAMQSGRSKAIELSTDVQFDEPILIDQHKTLQILINLIRNAIQAVAERGGSEQRVTVTVSESGGVATFAVRDSGIGIDPANLTRIFAHGFTTKADGHGFGLHSAANAAREMGGNLTAASDGVGRGATFLLTLPAVQANEKVA
jgi:signal transduction histidine kinase